MNLQAIIDQVDDVWVPNTLTDAQKVAMLNAIQSELYREVDFPNDLAQIYTTTDVELYDLPADCPADRIRHVVLSDSDDNETEYEFQDLSVVKHTGYFYSILQDTKLWIYPTPTVSGGTASGIVVTDGGSGYTSAPTVTFSGGGGSGAAATATLSGGKVTSVTITAAGTDYTSVPTVSFTGGGGSGAAATATIYTDSVYLYYAPSPTAFSVADLTVSPATPSDYHQYYVWRLSEMVAKSKKDVALANNFKADADVVLMKMIRKYRPTPATGFQAEVNW